MKHENNNIYTNFIVDLLYAAITLSLMHSIISNTILFMRFSEFILFLIIFVSLNIILYLIWLKISPNIIWSSETALLPRRITKKEVMRVKRVIRIMLLLRRLSKKKIILLQQKKTDNTQKTAQKLVALSWKKLKAEKRCELAWSRLSDVETQCALKVHLNTYNFKNIPSYKSLYKKLSKKSKK